MARLLPKLDPKIISVEMSPAALMFRRKHAEDLLKSLHVNLCLMDSASGTPVELWPANGAIEGISLQIALPYEYTASKEFAVKTGIPVVCVDDSSASRPKLSLFDEMISINNLEVLRSIGHRPHLERVENEYRKAANAFGRKDAVPAEFVALCGARKEEWEQRTRIMARRIRRLHKVLHDRKGGLLLHVGGWLHIGGGGRWPNLAAQLVDLAPRVLLLGSEPVAHPI